MGHVVHFLKIKWKDTTMPFELPFLIKQKHFIFRFLYPLPTALLLDSAHCVKFNMHLYHGFRPDGTKKAYVRLTPDFDALDVANKIGII